LYEAALDVLFIMNLALALNRLFVMVKLYILKQVNVSESAWELIFYKVKILILRILENIVTYARGNEISIHLNPISNMDLIKI